MEKNGRTRWLPVVVIVVLVAGSALLRDAIGVEWSAESVRDMVGRLGLWGPALFVVMVTFRILLLIPSVILLTVGGLCFGAGLGTVYGALGVALSGASQFGLARWTAREALVNRIPRRLGGYVRLANTGAGAALVTFATGYPFGPATAAHIGAGLTQMLFSTFVVALSVGAVVRAGAFSYFGDALMQGEGVTLASGILLAATVVPLMFPRVRGWLWGKAAS